MASRIIRAARGARAAAGHAVAADLVCRDDGLKQGVVP
jgi:hypothetical protein